MAATVYRKIVTYELPINVFENNLIGLGGTTVINWEWTPPYFWGELETKVTTTGPVTRRTREFTRTMVSSVLAQVPNAPPEEELVWRFTANTVFAERVRENL
jgi:hypothetical protein